MKKNWPGFKKDLKLILLSCLLFGIHTNTLIAFSPEDLSYDDRIYDPNIRTVNLYVNKGHLGAWNEPAVINIRKPEQLILKFDELYEDARYFQARIIHCNWDWKPSQLRPIEYLDTYNEFEISDYEYSVNARIPYTHYTFLVPRVNQPGNYLLVVYRRDEPEDIIITKRFIVYDHLITISPSIKVSSGIAERRTHQQLDFSIDYSSIEVFNPQQDIKVVIRKNQSWITAVYDLKPTRIMELQQFLEYNHFNLENNFYGGNEYRFFEIKTIHSPGRNVDRIFIKEDQVDAFLFRDEERGNEFYSNWHDLNGGYFIETVDGNEDAIESEYINVHFFLAADHKIASDVYVYGKLSHYNLLPEYEMNYDNELKGYRADILLKQGYYDFIYFTPEDPYVLEGSHFETRNDYEILVYYRPQGKITEYLIGYLAFNNNP